MDGIAQNPNDAEMEDVVMELDDDLVADEDEIEQELVNHHDNEAEEEQQAPHLHPQQALIDAVAEKNLHIWAYDINDVFLKLMDDHNIHAELRPNPNNAEVPIRDPTPLRSAIMFKQIESSHKKAPRTFDYRWLRWCLFGLQPPGPMADNHRMQALLHSLVAGPCTTVEELEIEEAMWEILSPQQLHDFFAILPLLPNLRHLRFNGFQNFASNLTRNQMEHFLEMVASLPNIDCLFFHTQEYGQPGQLSLEVLQAYTSVIASCSRKLVEMHWNVVPPAQAMSADSDMILALQLCRRLNTFKLFLWRRFEESDPPPAQLNVDHIFSGLGTLPRLDSIYMHPSCVPRLQVGRVGMQRFFLPNNTLTRLHMDADGLALPDAACEMLGVLLASQGIALRSLRLGQFDVSINGLVAIFRAIGANRSLMKFVYEAREDVAAHLSPRVWAALAQSIPANTTMRHLELNPEYQNEIHGNLLKPVAQALATNTGLRGLYVSTISDPEAAFLVELDSSLTRNNTLREMFLTISQTSNNHSFGHFLKKNSTLEKFECHLEAHPLAASPLFEGLQANSTLRDLQVESRNANFLKSKDLYALAKALQPEMAGAQRPVGPGLRSVILREGSHTSKPAVCNDAALEVLAAAMRRAHVGFQTLELGSHWAVSLASYEVFRDAIKHNCHLQELRLHYGSKKYVELITNGDAAMEEARDVNDAEEEKSGKKILLGEISAWLQLIKHYKQHDNLPSWQQLQCNPDDVSLHEWMDFFDNIKDNPTYVFRMLRNYPDLCWRK